MLESVIVQTDSETDTKDGDSVILLLKAATGVFKYSRDVKAQVA